MKSKKKLKNLKNKLDAFRFSYCVMKKGNEYIMAMLYATLIINGKKTIDQVPKVIREEVKKTLIDAELPELTEVSTVKGEGK